MATKYVVLSYALALLLLSCVPMGGYETTVSAAPIEIQVVLELSTYSLEISASPNRDTSRTMTGTVSITEKNPGETIVVTLYLYDDTWTYGVPDPGSFIFQQRGTQSFNLTVYLVEDAPPGGVYQMSISAQAESQLDAAADSRVLTIIPTWELAAETTLVEEPGPSAPGGTTSGLVEIKNSGSMYAEYFLVVAEDPDGVVEAVDFRQSVELAPNWIKKFKFDLELSDTATLGEHRVVLGLMTQADEDETLSLDTFSFIVEVVRSEEGTSSSIVIVSVLCFLGLMVLALLLRRKA